jgi:hypothetical protein
MNIVPIIYFPIIIFISAIVAVLFQSWWAFFMPFLPGVIAYDLLRDRTWDFIHD